MLSERDHTSNQPAQLLRQLLEHEVRLIVMGSAAGVAHGVERPVRDLDVVYDRAEDNLPRVVRALENLKPYPRGAEPGLDVPWDVETIDDGYSFIMTTSLGDLDLFAEISGIGLYEDVLPQSVVRDLWGMECRCLSPEQLVHNLRCSGRDKDFAAAKRIEEWMTAQ